MMRSLFSGVSGLRNHQVRMDVIGNNIANVNTTAFKASRVTFKETFAQIVQGASRPPGGSTALSGGRNPIQIGLGMNIGSIDMLFTQGNIETTGVETDLAVQGNSFFVVSDGAQNFYTRSGAFQLDANGRLVAATNGHVVQGRQAVNGATAGQPVGDIVLPYGQKNPANPTTIATLGGNLNASAAAGEIQQTSITTYDTQGGQHEVVITFTKTANPNEWDYAITASNIDAANAYVNDAGTVTFDVDGTLVDPETVDFEFQPDGFPGNQMITLDFGLAGTIGGLSQFAGPSTAVIRDQNGYTMGNLERISIDQTGTIIGAFSNGTTITLAQLVLSDFNNPSGLIRSGDNMYAVSPNSGAAVLGFSGEGSQSTVTSGALEMSNVDLAQEFTNLITSQRGFQSNARVITTSDEMLQELVNLKR
jgi:flagellar hook protein FlgE